ncbi:MAG: hydrogenase formation protein HypD, partial [Dehalococcoidales bacterium]|nr:hydrogenase formation protein HypD [Dehalococcoidales bacterium]
MKLVDEFRDVRLARSLTERIKQRSVRAARLMEFCGSHTVAIFKHGIRQLLPPGVEMMSGPGCPVCVTDNADIDKAIALAGLP